MSTPVWPAELPPAPLVSGSSYEPVSNAMPISVEAGELLTRRRFTGEMVSLNVALNLTRPQAITLLSFYRHTVREVLPFQWMDPLTGGVVEVMFTSAPQLRALGGDVWEASFTVMIKHSPALVFSDPLNNQYIGQVV